MTKASEVAGYRLYLKPFHLPPGGADWTITRATVEELHPRPGSEETKPGIVLAFNASPRLLVLNNGNLNRLVTIAGTDELEAWIGLVIHLKQEKLNKTKDTIVIEPPKKTGGPPAMSQPQEVETNGKRKFATKREGYLARISAMLNECHALGDAPEVQERFLDNATDDELVEFGKELQHRLDGLKAKQLPEAA